MGDSAVAPRSTFEAYRAEGDMLFKQQEFRKALESYNQALEIRQNERNCLVARSKCYLQMGDTANALKDAEASMMDDATFFKGLLCKADALYFKGEFEMALVFYHRGNKLRPEQHEFRLGIQKCQEAIDNSVGSPDKVKLSKEGDLSYFYKPQEEEALQKKKQQQIARIGKRVIKEQERQDRPVSGHRDKTIKQLLGALYADREYLEKLLKEEVDRLDTLGTCVRCKYSLSICSCGPNPELGGKYSDDIAALQLYSERFKHKKIALLANDSNRKKKEEDDDDDEEMERPQRKKVPLDAKGKKTKTCEAIHNLALNGIRYLDTRTDFWRQQKPMYARKRDKEMQLAKMVRKSETDPARLTLQKLTEIDDAHAQGKYKNVLAESKKLLRTLDLWSINELSNKSEVEANLHSYIGNAYLELGQYDEAVTEHESDLTIADELNNTELKTRAMDNLGRVYARMGKFEDAIKIWENRVSLKPEMQDVESAWLYHELGRCYLESNNTAKATEYGELSYSAARRANDSTWELHSSVLLAQAEVKLGDFQNAVDLFERAMDMAKVQDDKAAQKAIQKALDDVNAQIVQSVKGSDQGEGPVEEEHYEAEFEEQETGSEDDTAPEMHKPDKEAVQTDDQR